MPQQKAEKNRLYKVLGVPPNASEADIKKAYRKLAMVGYFLSFFLSASFCSLVHSFASFFSFFFSSFFLPEC